MHLGISAWAISATTIAALLAVVCIILVACLFTLLKMYRNGMIQNRHSSKLHNIINLSVFLMTSYIFLTYSETAEKEIEMKQNEVYGINTRPLLD